MCVVCGCGESGDLHYGARAGARVGAGHERGAHDPARGRRAGREPTASPRHNRAHFAAHGVTAYNLVSSPGSGKTTLLCATIDGAARARRPALALAVIEGDQQTSLDADRIRATGAPAIQVNTGQGCHLDARDGGGRLRAAGAARPSPRAWARHDDAHASPPVAAVHRERRQPRLPGAVGPGRARQGGDPVGDRRRGQAAQVPRHVRGRVACWC